MVGWTFSKSMTMRTYVRCRAASRASKNRRFDTVTHRMKGPYTVHSLSVRLSHKHLSTTRMGSVGLGAAAMDECSDPLDAISIPGKCSEAVYSGYVQNISRDTSFVFFCAL